MRKYAVAIVLRKKINDKKFLVVKRSFQEKEHPGMWGFPAISFNPPELPENALKRIGEEKLNCKIEPFSFLDVIFQERPYGELILLLYEAYVKEGNVNVKKAKKTNYIEQKWSEDFQILLPISKKGSACAQIFLKKLGIIDEKEIIKKVTEEMLKNL